MNTISSSNLFHAQQLESVSFAPLHAFILTLGPKLNCSEETKLLGLCACSFAEQPHLAHGAVEARLHVVLALVAGVDEAVLALVVQLHQHAHGAPLGPPQRAELQVLVSGQSQEGVSTVHQVAGHQGVEVRNGGQRVGGGAGDEANDKEDLGIVTGTSVLHR